MTAMVIPVDLPILVIAKTEDPVGGKTITNQSLIGRYIGSPKPWTTSISQRLKRGRACSHCAERTSSA
jgi:hypothetical protein